MFPLCFSAYIIQWFRLAQKQGEAPLNEIANDMCLQARRRQRVRAAKQADRATTEWDSFIRESAIYGNMSRDVIGRWSTGQCQLDMCSLVIFCSRRKVEEFTLVHTKQSCLLSFSWYSWPGVTWATSWCGSGGPVEECHLEMHTNEHSLADYPWPGCHLRGAQQGGIV